MRIHALHAFQGSSSLLCPRRNQPAALCSEALYPCALAAVLAEAAEGRVHAGDALGLLRAGTEAVVEDRQLQAGLTIRARPRLRLTYEGRP